MAYDIRKKWTQVTAVIFALFIAAVFILKVTTGFPGEISLLPNYHKEMYHFLKHPKFKSTVESTKWSAFGRTDLLADANNPDEKVFFIDGSAGSRMYRFSGDYSDSAANSHLYNRSEEHTSELQSH